MESISACIALAARSVQTVKYYNIYLEHGLINFRLVIFFKGGIDTVNLWWYNYKSVLLHVLQPRGHERLGSISAQEKLAAFRGFSLKN